MNWIYYGNASLRSDAQNHLCMRVKSGPLEVEFRTLVVWLSILAYKGYMTKYGHETCDFFMKNRKKGHPIDFLAHNQCCFDRIDVFFWTKYRHGSRGFFMKFLKKSTWEQSVFEKIDVFWRNMGVRRVCSLENARFSDKNAHVSSNFFVKNRK